MTSLVLVSLILLVIAAFVAVEVTAVVAAVKEPPRKALPPPCEVQCLEAKNAALQKLAVKRLKGWDRANRRAANLRRSLLHHWTMVEAIKIASIVYRVPESTLSRRMYCESHGYRYAHNASGATSYWQFMPSTWASTPFASLSIYSPFGQAMAAGWMMGPAGRGGEWSCR